MFMSDQFLSFPSLVDLCPRTVFFLRHRQRCSCQLDGGIRAPCHVSHPAREYMNPIFGADLDRPFLLDRTSLRSLSSGHVRYNCWKTCGGDPWRYIIGRTFVILLPRRCIDPGLQIFF